MPWSTPKHHAKIVGQEIMHLEKRNDIPSILSELRGVWERKGRKVDRVEIF